MHMPTMQEPGGTAVSTSRVIHGTAPVTIDGSASADLSADRTIAVAQFDATHAGVVPASGGGTTNFLRADGTWAAASSLGKAFFGDGSDGDLNFDGASTVLGFVPVSGVYTLNRDIFANNLTCSATIRTGGWRVFVRGVLNGGAFDNSGGDGSTSGTGGAASLAGFIGGGGAGGSGGDTFPATNGGNKSHVPREFAAGHANGGNSSAGANGGIGQGGGGGDNSTGGGGQSGDAVTINSLQGTRDIFVALQGHVHGEPNSPIDGATGGGGGRGNGNVGGGGGGGGGWIIIAARTITGVVTVAAKGGNGANGSGGNSSGGGGGGGGVAVVVTDSATAPTPNVAGGTGGSATGTGFKGGNGGAGITVTYALGA